MVPGLSEAGAAGEAGGASSGQRTEGALGKDLGITRCVCDRGGSRACDG